MLQPESLGRYLQAAGIGTPPNPGDPAVVLGHVDREGRAVAGPVTVGIWGLDAVDGLSWADTAPGLQRFGTEDEKRDRSSRE